jgi:NADPH:quinone reductase-like Zn-dependent oxidoreductase
MRSTLNEPSQTEAASRGVRYTARPDGTQLTRIASLIDEGKIRAEVAESYPFDATADAVARLERGHVHGKIVVDVLSIGG